MKSMKEFDAGAKADEIVLHLHGPAGETLYHTRKVIRDALTLALRTERERCARIVCPHEPGHPALLCCQLKKEIRGS